MRKTRLTITLTRHINSAPSQFKKEDEGYFTIRAWKEISKYIPSFNPALAKFDVTIIDEDHVDILVTAELKDLEPSIKQVD